MATNRKGLKRGLDHFMEAKSVSGWPLFIHEGSMESPVSWGKLLPLCMVSVVFLAGHCVMQDAAGLGGAYFSGSAPARLFLCPYEQEAAELAPASEHPCEGEALSYPVTILDQQGPDQVQTL